jgi:type II secretory pathway component PulK/phosphotransferase system HPr-like phosphotransfer protein
MMHRCAPANGVALIVVLWVLVILSMVVLSFAAAVGVHTRASTNIGRKSMAYLSAMAGIDRVILDLENDENGYDGLDELWPYVDSHNDELLQAPAAYQISVIDECSKLDINTATPEALLALPGMTEELVDAIIDWRDEDDEPRPMGAEEEYYQALAPPYHCANQPFQTVEELLLVKGMTRELLYGLDEEQEPLSPAERARAEGPKTNQSQDGKPVALIDLVTIYSMAAQEGSDAELRLDANEATEEQILQRLASVLDEQAAEAVARDIVRRREDNPFERLRDLWQIGAVRQGDRDDQKARMAAVVDVLGIGAVEEQQGGGQTDQGGEAAQGGSQGQEGAASGGGQAPTSPGGLVPTQPGTGGGGGGGGGQSRATAGLVTAILYAQLLAQGAGTPSLPGGMPGLGGGGAPATGEPTGQPGAAADEEPPPEEGETAQPPLLEDPVAGLININTAPIEVLATLPEMTQELANAIVARREAQPFAGRGDIVNLENVDPQVLGNLLDHITANSNAYRMYALGTIDETEIAVHVTAVVDMTQSPARIRYFRQDN